MAVLVSSDIERPAILGPDRQEQLRFDTTPPLASQRSPAPPPTARVPEARPSPTARPVGDPTKRSSGELTLDEMLVVAWEGVTAHHEVSCPVCRGAMVPRYAVAGPESLGGRCRDCGSTLA